MQVSLQIVAFSLQIIGSGRPVLTKGKRSKMPQSGVIFAIKRRGRSFCSIFSHSEFEALKLKGNIKYQKTKTLFK